MRRPLFIITGLLVGGVVLPIAGWIVAAVFLWREPRWSRGQKVLGTVCVPGGLLAPLLLLVGRGALLEGLVPRCSTYPGLAGGARHAWCSASVHVGQSPAAWVAAVGLFVLALAGVAPLLASRSAPKA